MRRPSYVGTLYQQECREWTGKQLKRSNRKRPGQSSLHMVYVHAPRKHVGYYYPFTVSQPRQLRKH